MIGITSFCRIHQNKLLLNGETLFEMPVATLDEFMEGAYRVLNPAYPKFFKMDRLSKLGFLASEVLLGGKVGRFSPASVALVLSNAHASLDTDVRYFETTKTFASPALFVYTLPNIVAGEICIRHGLKGENAFFISALFDAALLADYVDLVLAHQKTQACVAGWIDVMHNDGEVFLYLAEKTSEKSMDHSANTIFNLYQGWNS
jgi:hypothetical protein